MIYLSPGNKWSIPTIMNEIQNNRNISFLYRDKLGRIQKGIQNKKLMFKSLMRCGTKCAHCNKEGLHFELTNMYNLRIATNDGFLNVEHIIPKSLGGTDINYNVTVFCDICNTSKGNMLTVPHPKSNQTISKNYDMIRFGKFLKKYLRDNNIIDTLKINKIFELMYGKASHNIKIATNNTTRHINKFNKCMNKLKLDLFLITEDITLEFYFTNKFK